MRRYRRYFASLACVAVVAIIGPCRFGYYSVCTECGAIRHTEERDFPLTDVPYWASHWVEVTPVSRVCVDARLVGEHRHTWQFGQGNTYPLWSCSLGRRSSIVGRVLSGEVAAILKNAAEFGSAEEARRWLRLTLDADSSRFVVGALIEGRSPKAGFETAEEYKQWSAERSAKMDRFVAERIELAKH